MRLFGERCSRNLVSRQSIFSRGFARNDCSRRRGVQRYISRPKIVPVDRRNLRRKTLWLSDDRTVPRKQLNHKTQRQSQKETCSERAGDNHVPSPHEAEGGWPDEPVGLPRRSNCLRFRGPGLGVFHRQVLFGQLANNRDALTHLRVLFDRRSHSLGFHIRGFTSQVTGEDEIVQTTPCLTLVCAISRQFGTNPSPLRVGIGFTFAWSIVHSSQPRK